MEIKLYTPTVSTPTLDAVISEQVQGVKIITKLPGGFGYCSFRLKADLPQAWDWLSRKSFYRIVITDKTKILFDGRIEDIGLAAGFADCTAYGYYSNLSDRPYTTAYNDVASNVIKTVLAANCTQIDTATTNLAATDITINSAAGADYLDIYPDALVDKVLLFSDSTNGRWDFAVWENTWSSTGKYMPLAYLTKRNPTTVTWLVNMKDFVRFKLVHRAGEMWNSAYAVYTDSTDTILRTASSEDTSSQSKYGVTRQYVVPNLGQAGATAAQSARNMIVENFANVLPKLTEATLGGYVYDTKGVRYPSAWVRAGEVIRIRDLIPASAMLDQVTLDTYRTFFITETNYDADRNELSMVFDTENTSLDSVLARRI